MRKFVIAITFITSAISSSGQTIETLENEIRKISWPVLGNEKRCFDLARKLQEIAPFNYYAIEQICEYYSNNSADSIPIFFDQLIRQHPGIPDPYHLRTHFHKYERSNAPLDEVKKAKVSLLNNALQLDSTNKKTLYLLASTYYSDFIDPLPKRATFETVLTTPFEDDSLLVEEKPERKRMVFEYAADSALKYFYALWQADRQVREVIYFPIRQLECHLGQTTGSPVNKKEIQHCTSCYFPASYFVNLSDHWECDQTIDYLKEIEISQRFDVAWLHTQLNDLREPCLYDVDVKPGMTIFRFTWLRSFDHPISIRIENDNNDIILYWKIGKGAGGYPPQGIKKTGRKKVSAHTWKLFLNLIDSADFDNRPNQKEVLMTDGASWTLERKTHQSFKAHKTNMPDIYFQESCLFLLRLAKIKIKEEDIY